MKQTVSTLLGLAAFSGAAFASPITLSLAGTIDTDLWGEGSLTKAENPGYPAFPGSGAWPASIQSPVGGDAYLYKIDNGTGGGGPFPSQSGLYFGGTSTQVNRYGGSLGIADDTPLGSVNTVALQIEIGQAYAHDLFNNDPALVTLSYTTASGTYVATQSYAEILRRSYLGSVQMPTGAGGALQPEDIDINLWGLQWDLSGVTETILSYNIQFAAVEHASLRALQLDQTTSTYGATAVFPGDFVFAAAGNNHWSDIANWQSGELPTIERSARLTGSGIVVDSNQSAGTVKIAGNDGFELSSTGGAVLSTKYGITTSADAHISAPLHLADYNLIEVGDGTTLTLTGPVTGSGFYKQGGGDFVLSGNNVFDENDTPFITNGLVFRGGTSTVTGTNTYGGMANTGFHVRQDTTVVLTGGDNRLDTKFIAYLNAPTSRLVLGADGTGNDQTFSGLNGVAGAQIVNGGGADLSTLTINNSADTRYLGRLGGNGSGQNNLALVKTGAGVLTLGNGNTHTGGTTLLAGLVNVTGNGAFGNGPLTVDGGGIQYGAAFDGLRAMDLGAGGATIDTQTFRAIYDQAITGSGRFTKSGQIGVLTLAGDNTWTGGVTIAGGYLSVDSDARLGAVPASPTTDNLYISGGNAVLWASETFTLNANRGIVGGGVLGVAAGKTLSYGGVVSDTLIEGTLYPSGLYKTGKGTLVLSGDHTYSSATVVTEGRLVLDFSAAAPELTSNILNTGAGNMVLLYGGDLEVIGKSTGTTSQSLPSITLGQTAFAGAHVNVKVDSNGGDGTTLALGSISRSGGGTVQATVNFDLPAVGAITTTTTTQINGVLASATGNGVAYATVGNSDWASLDSGKIVALSTYETSADPANWATTENIALSANATGVTTRTINTLKLTEGADLALADGQTLTLTTGGILVTGTGASEITGGTIRGANGSSAAHRDLIVFQNNTAGAFTIGSVISDNSGATATSFVKSGDGELILTGTNTYTGRTYVQGGTLTFSSDANLGTQLQLYIDDATLRYTGAGGSVVRTLILGFNGATLDASGAGALVFGSNASGSTSNLAGNYARTLTLTGTNTDDNVYNNVLRDASAGATTLVKSGSGTWVLAPGETWSISNSFTGGIVIREGTLKVGRVNALNTAQPNLVTFSDDAPAGTRLALSGYSLPVAGLASGSAHAIVENGAVENAVLTIANGTNQTFAGTLRDGAGGGTLAFVKTGSGIQTLTGASTYTGATTVEAGTLALASGGSLASTSLAIAPGGEFDVSALPAFSLTGFDLAIGTDGFAAGLFDASSIALTLGGDLILNFTNTTTLTSGSVDLFAFGSHAGSFDTVTLAGNFAGALSLTGSDTWTGATDGYEFAFDAGTGVLSYAVVPEPSTGCFILGTGLLALGFRRRRTHNPQ